MLRARMTERMARGRDMAARKGTAPEGRPGTLPLIPRILGGFPVPGPDEVVVIPVGGVGRIGMNWTLYGHDGRWILVDAGTAFPDDRASGVEAIVPDVAALSPLMGLIDGLVVTHGHQDHIGAIERVWTQGPLHCPIYATPFAAGLISKGLEEAGLSKQVRLKTFKPGSSFKLGRFDVQTISMTHSIPEAVAVALKTKAGTVLHTGDWKFDPEPLVGPRADLPALRKLGDEGVMAMLCDSTNADKEAQPSSEADVRDAFRHVFSSRSGAVVVVCFGSNVARMASAAYAAAESGRKIAVAGRSMRNCEGIASDLGLMPAYARFLAEPNHLQGLGRRETALVCTGSQGEERAFISKLAAGRGWPRLQHGDTVILSARVIPGNEEAVETLVDALKRRGVEVLDGGMRAGGMPLHVTGHPCRDDLRTMYGLVRPSAVIPVHGTPHLLEAHGELARAHGCVPTVPVQEGCVFSIRRDGIRTLGRLPIGTVEFAAEETVSAPRRRMAEPASAVAMR